MGFQLKYEPTPENARRFAEDIVGAARDVSKVNLDYSPESLKQVDIIVEGFREEGSDADRIGATLFGFGCYVGEIFVRNVGAVWKKTDETPLKGVSTFPLVVEVPNGKIVNPIGKVFKRFENGNVDGLVYFYHVFAAKAR